MLKFFNNTIYNTIKDPHWYAVQGSDTTMLPIAASLFGQKYINSVLKECFKFKIVTQSF